MNQKLCPFCNERPATLLCDFVIGFEWDGVLSKEERHYSLKTGELEYRSKAGLRFIAVDGEMFTCDRPICTECATNEGVIYYCGKHCDHDSIDYCPQCKDVPRDGLRAITKEEADAEREKMWARSSGMLRLQACQ